MNQRSCVLVVVPEPAIAAAIAGALRRRGHEVTTAVSAAEALAAEDPDVLVCDLALAGGAGLELLDALHRRGARPHTVLVGEASSAEQCRRAIDLGAAELLPAPFRLGDLVRAVEERGPQAAARDACAQRHRAEYLSDARAATLAGREISAWALRCGVGPSARARLAGAVSEIVDNASRHGYPRRHGQVRVEAELEGREIAVEVVDQGTGFEPRLADGDLDCAQSGIARVASLSESVEFDSRPGQGTRVAMRFTVSRVEFDDEEDAVDLSELDFLTPDVARRVLRAVRRRDTAGVFQLSPALAVVVGRMLSGPGPARREDEEPRG